MKLEIDIPPGTTRIDLAPILLPIVRALLDRMGKDRRWTTAGVEFIIEESFEDHKLHGRIEQLRLPWVCRYLIAREWVKQKDDEEKVAFTMRRVPPQPVPNWWYKQNWAEGRHHITIYRDDHHFPQGRFDSLRKGLIEVAEYEGRSMEEVVSDIEAFAPPLHQLAAQADWPADDRG